MIVASVSNVVVWMVWVGAAFACLASGVAVISFRNPFYSALALIGNLGSLAVLYLLLSAEFVAAAQVLVYAGAVLAGGAILAEVIVVVGLKAGGFLSNAHHVDRSFGSPESIGKLFLTDHLLAFEITSIVLLVAAVGGVVLGSHARQVAEGDARA